MVESDRDSIRYWGSQGSLEAETREPQKVNNRANHGPGDHRPGSASPGAKAEGAGARPLVEPGQGALEGVTDLLVVALELGQASLRGGAPLGLP